MSDARDTQPPAPGASVELHEVVRIFEGDVHALDGVDLAVEPGEFVAITGPSGCGKSTLLNLVAALDFPTTGHVLVDGRDLHHIGSLARFRREQVGLVFQFHNLLAHQPVLANVEVAMFGTGRPRRECRSRARELLADEPTGSLDSGSSRRVLDLFGHVRAQGTTIILVTHDVAVAQIADRVVDMVDGRIRGEGGSGSAAMWMRATG